MIIKHLMKMQYGLQFSVVCRRCVYLGLSANDTSDTALNFGDLYWASWKSITAINIICTCKDVFPSFSHSFNLRWVGVDQLALLNILH